MLFSLVLSVHVVACVFVILAVLLQSGKGGGMSGIFGGGGSDAVFSAPSGTSFIKKVTAGLAVAFFVTSLLLTYLGSHRGVRSVTREFSIPVAPAASETKVPTETKPESLPAASEKSVPEKKQ
ncbi:MAG: preprotein translocase subunit SecG [Elusimicrobia bacterium]|nr:preprotein translocase subunit SecG [Elusimicrobiota bacterium]MBP9698496.1 preprotein translocase subunit SecG [Elusimicrobiota bacterium]